MEQKFEITTPKIPAQDEVLTPDAIHFLGNLQKTFSKKRELILKDRIERQHLIDNGQYPKALRETIALRNDDDWQVAPIPKDLERRWVEITGPTDKKMVINALNSGADVFMADFEDANSPTWSNVIEGQANLKAAVKRELHFKNEAGKEYKLNETTAVLFCRPRGWHLLEKHFLIDGQPMSASLFDFGLYFFHNAKELLKRGSGPYFYLPKLENHLEARLWNEIFVYAQNTLEIPVGSIKATVLLETILASFEMDEILWELKEHSAGLNAGRWDYIFSIIKKFHGSPIVFPDRDQITMSTQFMKTYAELLVRICHKRKIHAIGGMSAFIPSRSDPNVNKNAFARVFEDKTREVSQGFDGTWVAHPDLVQLAREPFEKRTALRLNQINFPLPDINIKSSDLLKFDIPDGTITEKGVRENISVMLHYMSAWFTGVGAVAINNLMEDAATAEISRSELWQWHHNPKALIVDIGHMTREIFDKFLKEEYSKLSYSPLLSEAYKEQLPKAKTLLERLVYEKKFPEFLTTAAYEQLG